MRVLVVGTGGVGSAFAAIAQRRSFFEQCALADYDPARPSALVAELDDDRFSGHGLDASSQDAVVSLIRETRADVVLNAVDPLFDVPVFDACIEAGVTYLDMAMTLSEPHPTNPYESGSSRAPRTCSRATKDGEPRKTYLYHVAYGAPHGILEL